MNHWKISDLKSFALSNNIPIIQDEGLNYIQDYIKTHNMTSVLEIGTAYGYSAVSLASSTTHVDTIERDLSRSSIAAEWIERLNANVTLYTQDALSFNGLESKYDLIFIDAAKSQYEVLFNKYGTLLKPGGTIICDNINFHNLTVDTVKNRRTRSLIKKLEKFKIYLNTHPDYDTLFLDIGDGLSVSKKRI